MIAFICDRIIDLIFDKVIARYRWKKENAYLESLGGAEYGSRIDYPAIIARAERIRLGENTRILANSRLQTFCLDEREGSINIGANCYIGYRCTMLAGGCITIGDNVLIAHDVSILSESHSFMPEDAIPYMDQELVFADVTIGNNCWIGANVTILPGVSVGTGCVIGANSVVNMNIPDYCVAAGVPARIKKKYDFGEHRWG